MEQQSNFQEILEEKSNIKIRKSTSRNRIIIISELYEDLKRFNESLREQSNEDKTR